MAYRERINKKTGKKEYKYRFYFIENGKRRDTDTPWYESKEKAEQEGLKLKAEKEKLEVNKDLQRRDKRLGTAFLEFEEELRQIAESGASNTHRQHYTVARSIYRNHMTPNIKNLKVKDIDMFTFRKWLTNINNKQEVGGLYVRLCRRILIKFNVWLGNNGYYVNNDYQIEENDMVLRKTTIKNSKVNNREDDGLRTILGIDQIKEIGMYFIKKDIGLFKNFYYYTLFYVLFFSGMRVEELAGLQWKFIDLRESERTISIKNAISKLEDKQCALERVRKGVYRTKNKMSVRIIPIFDFYYDLLKDYKESYKYEYGVSNAELEECFVFPNINQNDPHIYMRNAQALADLKPALKYAGVENTDLQMFRHSCAMFLILPPPDGLGYTEEKVKDYFGHTDTNMLTKVYARLGMMQKADRMKTTFGDIYKPSETKERTEKEELKLDLISRVRGNNPQQDYAREKRIFAQIDNVIKQGKKKYYYNSKDKEIIEEYKSKNNSDIEFVEE